MKKTLLSTLILSTITVTSFAAIQAQPGNTTNPGHLPMVKSYIPLPKGDQIKANKNTPQPPLNRYGAVNVNAHVPYQLQVPAEPKNFKGPKIVSLTQNWPELSPSAPQLSVRSYVLMSPKTGQVIAAYHANQRQAPASLTKLMLLYITAMELNNGTISINSKVRVPTVAWATGGSRMFLNPGSKVELKKLIEGTIVASGNDAAVTIAKYIAGSQSAFVSMMNETAQQMGLTNTHFTDVMGLPAPDHYSSARDMTILAQHITEDFPQYLSWYGQKYFDYNAINQTNYNRLLFIDKNAFGFKTGSTNAAGYSLVGGAKDPQTGMKLISVVMGSTSSESSATDSQALLTYGFRFFKNKEVYPAHSTVMKAKISGGANKYTNVGVNKALWITIPKNTDAHLSAKLLLKKDLSAPIKQGQVVGKIVVSLDGKPLATAPAVALQANAKGSFFQRLKNWF